VTGPSSWWPLTHLRIVGPDVTLRPLTEADLAPLAERLPADVEFDPALPAYDGLDASAARGTALHQTYWRALGNWRVESWDLLLAVETDGATVGVQSLEGKDFPRRRTVESWSFLLPDVRGRGVGKSMRRAVLALAFDQLGALAAETEALQSNSPSLGVSRAVGYLPNGETLHASDNGLELMLRLRLTRERWLASGAGAVEVTGFDACRPLFGMP
jgi:RimJ/RimL family protein N-acetyltransferase